MRPVPWYNIFSYWGFVFWLAWLGGFVSHSPLLVILINLVFSIAFVCIKYRKVTPVGAFIVGTHIFPLVTLRHAGLDLFSMVYLYLAYLIWLEVQGIHADEVYRQILEDPAPKTVREYLKSRLLLRWQTSGTMRRKLS
jgi:hypothetical protein